MFCDRCGTEIYENMRFCPKCGTAVNMVPIQQRQKYVHETQKNNIIRTGNEHMIKKDVCSKCGHSNEPNVKFCSKCGNPIYSTLDNQMHNTYNVPQRNSGRINKVELCSRCGSKVDGSFCPKCGTPVNQNNPQHFHDQMPSPHAPTAPNQIHVDYNVDYNIDYNPSISIEHSEEKGFGRTILSLFASKVGKIALTIIFALIVWGVLIALLMSNKLPLMYITLLICGFFGWKVLNMITSKFFLWMNFMGWIVYFCVKGVLSILVGWVVAPFKIASMISEYAIKVLGASAKYIQNSRNTVSKK